MARKKRARRVEEDEPGLDISSLIDVCFLLLIYFLVTTTIAKKEQDLSLALPTQTLDTDTPEIKPLLIRVDANGFIFLKSEGGEDELLEQNPESRDLPNLSPRLQIFSSAAKAGGDEPVVQVRVDGEAEQQRVVDVLNAIAGAGITKATFTDLIDDKN